VKEQEIIDLKKMDYKKQIKIENKDRKLNKMRSMSGTQDHHIIK